MGFIAAGLTTIINILLVLFLWKRQKKEKTVFWIILLFLAAGMIPVFLTPFVQAGLTKVVDFVGQGLYEIKVNGEGISYKSFNGNVFNYCLYNFLINIFAVGFNEELLKDLFCFLIIVFIGKVLKREQLKTTYECILYTTITAIGFGLVEDILYVIGDGLDAGFVRIATEISGHMFYGAIFGYFFAKARSVNAVNLLSDIVSKKNGLENRYKKNPFKYLIIGFIVAVCVHGFYDSLFGILPGIENQTAKIILYIVLILYIIACYVFCIRLVLKCSKQNEYFADIAREECKKLYPEIELGAPNVDEENIEAEAKEN